jgi:glycosyltransferase involved in cell wall biosynthesis
MALIARGLRPVLVFSNALPVELHDRYRQHGVKVTAIDYEKGILHYFRELRTLVESHSVETVHIAFFNYFSLIPWMSRLRGVRHIVFQERNSGVLRARSWKKQLLRIRTRVTTWPVTQVIAISEYLRKQLVEVGVSEKKISVVYHGVDVDRFRFKADARKELLGEVAVGAEELLIVSATSLLPWKNPQVAIDACALLTRRGVPVRLLYAGVGPLWDELQARCRAMGIADRVHWMGYYREPERLFQACDVYLHCSTGEAFGFSLAEAMACGAPVVASRSGAVGELVADGRTGILATPQDASSFADALESLFKNPAARQEMGLRGCDRVREHFTLDSCVENTMRALDVFWRGRPSENP